MDKLSRLRALPASGDCRAQPGYSLDFSVLPFAAGSVRLGCAGSESHFLPRPEPAVAVKVAPREGSGFGLFILAAGYQTAPGAAQTRRLQRWAGEPSGPRDLWGGSAPKRRGALRTGGAGNGGRHIAEGGA